MKRTAFAVVLAASGVLLAGCSASGGEAEGYTIESFPREPPEGPVPGVVGEPFVQACETLQGRGYLVGYSPTRVVEGGGPVRVVSQDPRAGREAGPSEARQAGVVKLRLSGPPPEGAFTPEGACLSYDEVTLGE